MRVRFYNGFICTMAGAVEAIEAELWTENDIVAYVGPPRPNTPAFDREIDLDGNLLLPGFKNAHSHSAMTFLRSRADDLPLLDWLEKCVFPMESKLTQEQAYIFNVLAIMEYLTSGITAAMDMYFTPEALAKATVDTGFRSVLVGAVNNHSSSVEAMEQDYLRFNAYHSRVSAVMGFHAEYTCTEDLLRAVAQVAARHKAPVFAHNSESAAETADCLARTGQTPTAYLDSLGLFAYGGGGYHCVHLTEADMDIFYRRGLYAVTNPAANCKLASGIAPVTAMLAKRIPVALGTDGPAGNNSLDMFREMFLVTALQKISHQDAAALKPGEVLTMATRTSAAAMGLTDCDCLAAGKQADLIVIDMHQPNMQPVNNRLGNLVYAGSKQNVKLTMIQGKILYEDGVFYIGVEPREVYAEANAMLASMG